MEFGAVHEQNLSKLSTKQINDWNLAILLLDIWGGGEGECITVSFLGGGEGCIIVSLGGRGGRWVEYFYYK